MSLRTVTVRVEAVCGKPGLSGCGCSGDGSGGRVVLIPRIASVVLDGSGSLRGIIINTPRSFKSVITSKLLYTLYDIQYDDTLLIPGTILAACDLAFTCCEGCEVTYFDRRLSQFCSNVAMTEGEDGILHFSGCSGVDQQFQLGATFVPEVGEGCTGIGDIYAIQQASISGSALNLRGAELPDSNVVSVSGGENLGLDTSIANAGTVDRSGDGIGVEVSLAPLSDCQGMSLYYSVDVSWQVNLKANWLGQLQLMGRRDIATFSVQQALAINAITERNEGFGFTYCDVVALTPGTPISLSWFPRIVTATPAADSLWFSWLMHFRGIYVTKRG